MFDLTLLNIVLTFWVVVISSAIVQIVFVIQKLLGVVDWSWVQTLCIIEFYVGIYAFLWVFAAVYYVVDSIRTRK